MNRRQLLHLLALGATVPTEFSLFKNALAQTTVDHGKRLILVELTGANDGLNTLVPVTNDHYHQHRPTLGLGQKEVTRIDDEFSINQALDPLMKLWDQGSMAWVHGLGYPSPNRSHFKSMAHWETGGDGQRDGKQGWLTHDIEHRLGRTINDAHGISMVGDMSLFQSDSGRWLNMTSPEQFLAQRDSVPIKTSTVNPALKLVTARMAELEQSLYGLSSKLAQTPKSRQLPGGELGAQLQQVVRLIRAGVDTPVFRVQLNGFDTHENQRYTHRTLLENLAQALAAFSAELKNDAQWDNTLIMTYSEFGRRATENKSGGTDHGTAAPHLILGGAVNSGLYGTPTDLSNIEIDGDPVYTMDYRALYSQVLSSWFGIAENKFSPYADRRLANLIS